MTKLIIVRHGQTLWNLEKKYQGHSDIALSDEGLVQAAAVAERLAAEKIDTVYASDLSRAFKTAEGIAAKHELTVNIVPELREIKFGDWEGLCYEQISE
ncbi:MAG: histidine phosphatase family protein, partial [Sporomusa sp.]